MQLKNNPEMRHKISEIVEAFYEKATHDFLIGYQFRKIALLEKSPEHPLRPPLEAFAHHLPRITHFWWNQLLAVPYPPETKPFNLIGLHKDLHIKRGELGRWLQLFRETLDERCVKGDELELKRHWLLKLTLFQQKFEKSPQLFQVKV